jgi:acetyltransferase
MGEITLRSGETVLIRPIRPDDKQRLVDVLERLGPESRYRRFFSAMPELRIAQLRYLTELDHHAHEALVAVDSETGQALGVARFVRSADDPVAAEVAVAVVDDWQRRGLATALLDRLSARAREEGVVRFIAAVLTENQSALDLFRRLGRTRATGFEAGVVELSIDLTREGIPAPLRHTVRAAARGDVALDPDTLRA